MVHVDGAIDALPGAVAAHRTDSGSTAAVSVVVCTPALSLCARHPSISIGSPSNFSRGIEG